MAWQLCTAVLLVNWPGTIVVIMPTNRRLLNTPAGTATAETRRIIGRWVEALLGSPPQLDQSCRAIGAGIAIVRSLCRYL